MEIQMDRNTLEAIRSYRLPRYHEIPDVGFYLNQAAKYINTYLQPFFDMNITESMISNYVKQHLVGNPEKKQYNRDQMAYLLFIAASKSVLSLDHIQLLVNVQKQTYELPVAYDYFCSEFENVLQYVFGIKKSLETVGKDSTDVKFLLRNLIVAIAHKIFLTTSFHSIEKK